jgi:hypothetical protein
MIRQAFGEENMGRTQVFEWKSPHSLRLKEVRHVKTKAKSILIIFFDNQGLVHEEFVPAEQTLNSAYS